MEKIFEFLIFLIYSAFFWATIAMGVATIAVVIAATVSTVRGFFNRSGGGEQA